MKNDISIIGLFLWELFPTKKCSNNHPLFFIRFNAKVNPSKLSILCILSTLTILASSCTPIEQKPFNEFSKSVVELQKNTDSLLKQNTDLSITRFTREALDDLKRNKFDKIEALANTSSNNRTAPIFLKSQRFHSGANKLNQTLVDYANYLAQLASPDRIPKDRIEAAAKDLNANANDAVAALTGKGTGKKAAILSTAAVIGFEKWQISKQKKHLSEAIAKNQPTIIQLSKSMLVAIDTAEVHAKEEYVGNIRMLRKQLAVDGAPASRGEQNKVVTQMVKACIEFHQNNMANYEKLRNAYSKLPKAHSELAQAAENPSLTLNSINAFMTEAKRVESIYDNNTAINNYKNAKREADEADRIATQAESNAKSLQQQADQAAKSAAEIPTDAQLAKLAENAKLRADRANANAVESRKISDSQQALAAALLKLVK